MRELTPKQLKDLIASLESDSNKSPHEDNPYHRIVDHLWIYFYHLDDPFLQPKPKPKLYIYRHERPMRNRQAIRSAVRNLSQDVVDGRLEHECIGFDCIEYRRISLIAILLDFEEWRFKNNPALRFIEGNGKEGNHTFFEAFVFPVQLSTGGVTRTASALCFANHMVDYRGEDLADGVREEFEYDLYVTKGRKIIETPIDPGGTNLGPPLEPP